MTDTKMDFQNLPSLRTLSSMSLGALSDELTLELMRRDAWAHPNPIAFDSWAAGGKCPYQNEDRYWIFAYTQSLWEPGPPKMRDYDLILRICEEKGWKINDKTLSVRRPCCPYCGNTPSPPPRWISLEKRYAVYCSTCEFYGPRGLNPTLAEEAWKRRDV